MIQSAATLTERYPLRAYHAVHLASARMLEQNLAGEGLLLASWDEDLERAAAREGVQVLSR